MLLDTGVNSYVNGSRHTIGVSSRKGGCRLIVGYLPSKRPWLNPIEPKWLHGKRAGPNLRALPSITELMQGAAAYDHRNFLESPAKPDCWVCYVTIRDSYPGKEGKGA